MTRCLMLTLVLLLGMLAPLPADAGSAGSDEVKLRSYLVPMPEFAKLFRDGRQFVVFPFEELEKLIREKRDWLRGRKEPVPPPRHRVLFHGARYGIELGTDSVRVQAEIELELYDDQWHQIPLFSGKLGIASYQVDRTDAVLLPVSGNERSDSELLQKFIPLQQSRNMSPDDFPTLGNDNVDHSTFFLIVQGRGRCRLQLEFFVDQQLSGGIYGFAFHIPPCPRNDLTLTPPSASRLTLRGALPETQAADAGEAVPFFFTLKPLIEVNWFPEKADEETSAPQANPRPPADGGREAVEASETRMDPASNVDREPARVMAEVDSIHSIGDGKVISHYRVTYRIHHASSTSFRLRLPGETDLVTLQGADMDFYRLAEGGRTLEVLLTTPKIGRYELFLHAESRIGQTREIALPLLEVLEVSGITGHCGISSHTGIEIMPRVEAHENSQLMDTAELPAWIQERSENPILYAYRYFYYPVTVALSLMKHPTAPGMVSCIDRCQLHSMVSKGGDVFGEARLDVKNNGESFLSFRFADTVEILEAAVNDRLVVTSVDKDGIFKLRLANSRFGDDGVVDSFPVRFKFRQHVPALESRGNLQLQAPVFDMDVMQLDWNVYSPRNYQFYGIQTVPAMTRPDRLPFVFRVASDFVRAVMEVLFSDLSAALFVAGLALLLVRMLIYLTRGVNFGAILSALSRAVPALVLLLIALFFLLALSTPNFNRAREQAKKKACISNMKTIEGATELYLMEKTVPEGLNLSLEKLTREGYLKTLPRCPGGGSYTVVVGRSGCRIVCSLHGGIDDTTTGLDGDFYVPSPDLTMMKSMPKEKELRQSARMDDDFAADKEQLKPPRPRTGAVVQQRAQLKGLSSIRIDLPKTTMAGYRRGFLLPAGLEAKAQLQYLSLRRFQWVERFIVLLSLLFLALLLLALRPGSAGRRGYLAAALLALAGVELIGNRLEVSEAMVSEAALVGISLCFVLLALYELFRGRYLALWRRFRPELPAPPPPPPPPLEETEAGTAGKLACLLILVLLLLPTAAVGEAREIRSWLPYNISTDSLEIENRMAVLTVEDLDWLLERTREVQTETQVSPHPFVIRDVHYRIEAGRHRARVHGTMTVVTWRDAWQEIPLVGGVLSFRDVTVNGSGSVLLTSRETDPLFNQSAFFHGLRQKVQFNAGRDFIQQPGEELLYYTILKGPGEFRVEFSFDAPVVLSDNVFAFGFSNPRIASSSLILSLDPSALEIRGGRYEKYDVEIPQSVEHSQRFAGPLQVFEARLAPTRQIHCRYKPMRRLERPADEGRSRPELVAPAQITRPRFVSALLGHTATLEENQLSGRVILEYDIRNEELRRLLIPLPRDLSIVQVDAPDMERYRVLSEGPKRHLRIDFRTAKIGRLKVRFLYESALAHDAVAAEIPIFHLDTVHRFKGFLALESLINADVSFQEQQGLVECDPSELRVTAERLGSTPLVGSFAYSETARLVLGLNRHEALAGIPLTVTRAEILSALEPGGRRVHLARYMVKNNGVQFLDIQLPAGATLASSRVADRMVRSGLQDGRLKVPMFRSARQGNEYSEFPVELIYFTQGKPAAAWGRIELELPRVDSIISQTVWRIALPEEIRAVWEETSLDRSADGQRLPAFRQKLKSMGDYQVRRESNVAQTSIAPLSTLRSTSSLPVPLDLPDMPQLRVYTQETVYSSTGGEVLDLRLDYLSTRSYHRLHLLVFLLGFAFCMLFLGQLYRRCFRWLPFLGFLAIFTFLQWLESWDLNVNEYGLLGLVSALLLQACAWLLTPDAFRLEEGRRD